MTTRDEESHEDGYLTFLLGGQTMGVPLNEIQEIIGMMPVTPVPRAAGFLMGVINLRGNIISLLDLRAKLGMDSATESEESCIIIVTAEYCGEATSIGMVVDAVSNVVNIEDGHVDRSESWSGECRRDFLDGIARFEEQLILLLNVQKVGQQELSTYTETTSTESSIPQPA